MAFPKFNAGLPKFDTSEYDEFENPFPEAPPKRSGLSAAEATDPYAVYQKQALEANAARWKAKEDALRAARVNAPGKMERIAEALLAFGAPTGGNNWSALSNAAKALSVSGAGVKEAERERANQLTQLRAQQEDAAAAIREKYGFAGAEAKQAVNLKRLDTPKVGFDPITGVMKFLEGVDVGKEVTPGGQPTTQAPSASPEVVTSGGYSFLKDRKGGYQALPRPPKEPATPEEIAAAIEARATAGVVGKEAGKALVALPGAKTQVARSLNLIDSLLNHKGLSAVVGAPNPFKGGFGFAQLPGSDAASFASQLKQLEGQAFLEAFTEGEPVFAVPVPAPAAVVAIGALQKGL